MMDQMASYGEESASAAAAQAALVEAVVARSRCCCRMCPNGDHAPYLGYVVAYSWMAGAAYMILVLGVRTDLEEVA